MSKKIAQQVKEGVHDGNINRDIADETFHTFCNALELKRFKATASNAFDLLDLAEDWQVAGLKSFVRAFISDQGLKRPTRRSKFQQFLPEDEEKLIDEVTDQIDKYLEDDRMLLLPPEILFRILLSGERKGADQEKLVNFIMKLFQYNPSVAVCQSLTLDFQALTNDQRNNILAEPLMHEQNLLYFISASLSSLRKRAKNKLAEMSTEHQAQLGSESDEIDLARGGGPDSVEGIISALKKQMKHQKDQITQLNAYLERQRKTIEAGEASNISVIQDLRDQIDRRAKNMEENGTGERARTESTKRERAKTVDSTISDSAQKAKEIVADHGMEMDQAREHALTQVERTRRQTGQMGEFFKAVGEMANKSVQELDEVRKVVATKAVLDKIRYDKFLRRTANRTLVYDESFGDWQMAQEEMQKMEKLLISLERSIDQVCPIIRKLTSN